MCIDCGCGSQTEHHHHHDHDHHHEHDHDKAHDHHHDQPARTVRIEEDLLAKNNRLASGNRALFREHGIFTLNLVSSPGSGKTSILEKTLRDLQSEMHFAVLEGDQQTANDADRIAATGVPVHQINTGAGCHLDAHMVAHGVEHFHLDKLDILMIENVGNLVCPASFDLGEDHKVAVLSVTEGEDKPLKYPHMFRAADLMLINKVDLLPYLSFDLNRCLAYARQINPDMRIIEMSCVSGVGMEEWYAWLRQQVTQKQLKAS